MKNTSLITDPPANGTDQRPIAEVLSRAWGDFTPSNPRRHPWHQPSHRPVTLAYTGNVVTVPLIIADRVQLHNVDRPTWERDDLEWFDWTPAGWGVASAPGE